MEDFILSLFMGNKKLKKTTLYQILVGKHTTSVLCYAYFHDLLPYFSVLPTLEKEKFDQEIATLVHKGYLSQDQQQVILKGELLSNVLRTSAFQSLNYFQFGRKEEVCWRSFRFLLQVTSFLGKREQYVPLENAPIYTERVRAVTHQYGQKLPEIIYEETKDLFQTLTEDHANLLAQALSGYQQEGAAFFQLIPDKYEQTLWSTLYKSAAIHQLLAQITKHPEYLLYQFLSPLLLQNYNQSMLQTRELVRQGRSIEQIKKQRKLKEGTIQDHLIEWSLIDSAFPFSDFLSQDMQNVLKKMPKDSFTYPFKELTELFEATFLEIRLYQIWRKKQLSC
ncbi:helix-turn-helix domain-containing protein [Tetragenococcus muriaticus]|uniref:helix-turn-helix domain-containing protein n=1 Tax=Tetragenococcus muriaticus TaxID=64642 RepID=UPI00041EA039|nr:helix-turn-helix domain-containing protein [Tetragenococcus muriaticus]GMA47451.1 hypothetical protein GCM10025854_17010 [Tetragenococcus muriaticus]